ncbi:hypothetical protein Pla52n_09690 [Stieleria varia]|uniref:Uncharacterized protein n=1 Tax=Stieleria varia TaxID=2528005 RepID=A0A5C6B9J0_9BACT|nr:hypothetical protein Pla52n_09690 [Stieleria varia]
MTQPISTQEPVLELQAQCNFRADRTTDRLGSAFTCASGRQKFAVAMT